MAEATNVAGAQPQQYQGFKEWQPQQQQQQQQPGQLPPQQPGQQQQFGGFGGGRGNGRGRGFQAPMAQQQLQLPPGWQLAYAPTGEPYYVDHNTKTTHWSPPASAFVATPAYGGRGGGGRGGRGRVGIDQMKRKTKMCMNFESGSCAWGEKCAFAHGAHELTAPINGPQ
jgi:hypothetical protein